MIPKLCNYCNDYCFVPANGPRYDGAAILASCPKGKIRDRACNVAARSVWIVEVRKLKPGFEVPKDDQIAEKMEADC